MHAATTSLAVCPPQTTSRIKHLHLLYPGSSASRPNGSLQELSNGNTNAVDDQPMPTMPIMPLKKLDLGGA